MRKTRIIIVNRRRFFACVFIAATIVSSAVCALAMKHTSIAYAQAEPIAVTISTGDTLWSIADEYANGNDIRVLIDDIMEINGLTSASIRAGDTLMIPNKYSYQ